MDFGNLVNDVIGNTGLLLLILGLVEWVRQLNVRGIALRISSMVIGIVFGGAALAAQAGGFPTDYPGIAYLVFAGLLFGLIASGIVDLSGRLLSQN